MRKHNFDNRNFGLLITLVSSAAMIWQIIKHAEWNYALLALAALGLLLSLFLPVALGPPRKLWMLFGETMSRVTQPLILGLVFFLVLTPLAIVRRAVIRRAMRKDTPTESLNSYWQSKSRTVSAEDLKRQF